MPLVLTLLLYSFKQCHWPSIKKLYSKNSGVRTVKSNLVFLLYRLLMKFGFLRSKFDYETRTQVVSFYLTKTQGAAAKTVRVTSLPTPLTVLPAAPRYL